MKNDIIDKVELIKVPKKETVTYEEGIISTLKRLIIPIILIPILLTGYFAAKRYMNFKSQYKATETILINRKSIPNGVKDDVEALNKNIVYTFGEMAKSSQVLEKVKQTLSSDLKVSDLKTIVSVLPKEQSQTIEINAITDDPNLSINIANLVSQHLKEVGKEIKGEDLVNIIDVPQSATLTGTKISIMDMMKNFVKYLAITLAIALVYSGIKGLFVRNRG